MAASNRDLLREIVRKTLKDNGIRDAELEKRLLSDESLEVQEKGLLSLQQVINQYNRASRIGSDLLRRDYRHESYQLLDELLDRKTGLLATPERFPTDEIYQVAMSNPAHDAIKALKYLKSYDCKAHFKTTAQIIMLLRKIHSYSGVDEGIAAEKKKLTKIATGSDGWTSLNAAAYYGDSQEVRRQLALGADPNATKKSGSTPLTTAAGYGHTDCLKALIDGGAKVNQAGKWGWSPLHFAGNHGHVPCVTALMKANADPFIKSDASFTPRDMSYNKNGDEIQKDLQEYEAIYPTLSR